MRHSKYWVGAAAITLVGIASPAVAADLSNGFGETCDGTAMWHFVNNQTGGASAGTLTAEFTDGTGATIYYTVGPTDVNRNTQHFWVSADGTLADATTGDLPGRLVLSEVRCEDVKKK